jgi:hypothetical protein
MKKQGTMNDKNSLDLNLVPNRIKSRSIGVGDGEQK